MRKFLFFAILVMGFVSGCATLNKDFVALVNEHSAMVNGTNIEMIHSIDAALAEPTISTDERTKLENLRARLDWTSRSATAMMRYVNEKDFDPEVLKEVIQNTP